MLSDIEAAPFLDRTSEAVPVRDGCDLVLKDFIDDMLGMSRFVYLFVTLRRVVRMHGERAQQLDTPKIGFSVFNYLPFMQKKEATVVKFHRPELVVTDWGAQDKDENKVLKYAITPAAVSEFLTLNKKHFRQEDSAFVFVEDGDDQTNFAFAKHFPVDDNLKFIDYDDSLVDCHGGFCYGVVANLTDRTITVTFRGTVGLRDAFTDLDFSADDQWFQGDTSSGDPSQEPPFTHRGFMTFLEQKRSDGRTAMDRILACLNEVYENNEYEAKANGFRLFSTGHSLGGALANLFAFRAAQLKDVGDDRVKHLPDVVRAMTFAAPCVGNNAYNSEFKNLERKGILRHIRISNKGDVIPTMGIPCPLNLFIRGDTSLYAQNGMNLVLLEPVGQVEVAYQNTKTLFEELLLRELGIHNPAKLHFMDEYIKRVFDVIEHNEEIANKTLECLYKESGGFNE